MVGQEGFATSFSFHVQFALFSSSSKQQVDWTQLAVLDLLITSLAYYYSPCPSALSQNSQPHCGWAEEVKVLGTEFRACWCASKHSDHFTVLFWVTSPLSGKQLAGVYRSHENRDRRIKRVEGGKEKERDTLTSTQCVQLQQSTNGNCFTAIGHT